MPEHKPTRTRTIRASELGRFCYCQRAWWYQLRGVVPENRAMLDAGTQLHQQHGQRVAAVGMLRTLAVVLLIAALLLVVYLLAGGGA